MVLTLKAKLVKLKKRRVHKTLTFDQLRHELRRGKKVLDRVKALEAIAETHDSLALHEIIGALEDMSPRVRSTAAEYVGRLEGKEAANTLLKLLSDPNSEVRMMAVSSLGELLEGRRAPLALIKRLRDSDELVRIETAESLGAIGDRKALPALWNSIRDKSPLVKSYVAGAIGRLGGVKDAAKLEQELRRQKSDTAKIGFYQALYELGQQQALVEIVRMLQSEDYRVRSAASQILSEIVANESNASIILRTLRKALSLEQSRAARDSFQAGIRSIRNRFKKSPLTTQRIRSIS